MDGIDLLRHAFLGVVQHRYGVTPDRAAWLWERPRLVRYLEAAVGRDTPAGDVLGRAERSVAFMVMEHPAFGQKERLHAGHE